MGKAEVCCICGEKATLEVTHTGEFLCENNGCKATLMNDYVIEISGE